MSWIELQKYIICTVFDNIGKKTIPDNFSDNDAQKESVPNNQGTCRKLRYY